jgi:hypothetical protein
MALDFDPAVIALASQPFRLVWADGDRDREHTPDHFARLSDGTGVVVDVRPESLVDEEAAEVFPFTARICATAGWQFRLVGDLDQPFRANLRWLARYRHPRCHRASVAEVLREVTWPILVRHLAPGGWVHPLTQPTDTAAVTTLHQLLREFFDAREQPDGLGKIFKSHQSWLTTQAWYQFETAEPDHIN